MIPYLKCDSISMPDTAQLSVSAKYFSASKTIEYFLILWHNVCHVIRGACLTVRHKLIEAESAKHGCARNLPRFIRHSCELFSLWLLTYWLRSTSRLRVSLQDFVYNVVIHEFVFFIRFRQHKHAQMHLLARIFTVDSYRMR